ncbi:hypothetical protein ACP6PM_34905 [Dapis sp. BLCC M229]
MGIDEIDIEDIKQGEVKKRYLIREILPKFQVGFRFLSGRRTQEYEVPKLFVTNQDSTVELNRKEDKGERDEISRIMNFVTFLILFFTLPQILELIPLSGDILAFLAKLVIFVIIVLDIGTFSKKIAELLILPFQRNNTQTAKYNVNVSKIEDSSVSIGEMIKTSYKQERETDEK